MERVRKIILFLLLIIFLAGIGFSSYKIFMWYKDVRASKKLKESLNEVIVEEPSKDNTKYEGKPIYNIDFNRLKEENPDTVAYIKLNNTTIDYVVVKGEDNSFYLTHSFDKSWNVAGWIFADYHNRFDGTDKNIVIFGHKMRDGSMFAPLKDTIKEEWYLNKDNYLIPFVTPEGTDYYKIYSLYTIVPELYYMNTFFNNEEEFQEFINVTKSRSIYDFKTNVAVDDQILTLSSCMDSYNQKRVVLHAKKIKKFE